MPLKPETEAWLKSLPLSKEVSEAFTKELEADHEKEIKVRQTVLAQSDYSRKMDELKAEREKLEQESVSRQGRADAMLKANVKWREDNQKVLEQSLQEKLQVESQLKQYQSKLQALVDQGLIDPADAQARLENAQSQTQNQPKYLTEKEFQAALQTALQRKDMEYAAGIANFGDLADEHFRIFGSHLKRADLFKEVAEKNISLEQAWENLYHVSDKRTELAKKELEDKLSAARQEERVKVLSEMSVNPGIQGRGEGLDDGTDKHILNLVKPSAGSGGVSDAVRAAKESWAKGEFRQK